MIPIILSLSLFGLNLKLVEQNAITDRTFQSSLAGKYLYQIEYTTDGIGETPIASFSLFDANHQLLTTLRKPGVEMIFVSDAGWFVGALNTGANVKLAFYDRSGAVRAHVEIDAPANYAFSPTGSCLYVSNAQGVQAFDARGRIVSRFGAGNWFLPSADDKLVATVSGNRVDVWRFGRNRPAASFRLSSLLFRDLAFSVDGELLAVAERSKVSLYSLRTTSLLWYDEIGDSPSFPRTEKQGQSPSSLLSVAVAPDGTVYVGGEEGSMAAAGFLSLYRSGTEQARAAIPYYARNEGLVGLSLDDTGVRVRTSDHLLRFEEAR